MRIYAAVLFALLVLGAGCCLFDHDGDGSDHHGAVQDLCLIMLVDASADLTFCCLAARGPLAVVGATALITTPLSVLDPPPRLPLLV
jgi:hypothetical protein